MKYIIPLVAIITLVLSNEDYHPEHCQVIKYNFAFIHTGDEYKVHGLWPDKCQECSVCSYPTCCNMEKFKNLTMPQDVSFISKHWLNGMKEQIGHICDTQVHTVFEHEVIKHASCMNMYAEEYMILIEKLYDKYNSYFEKRCHDCHLNLSSDFSIIE